MTSTLQKYGLLMAVLAIGAACSAGVLLNDTFADADRTETALPDESAVWFSHPANLTMGTGSLAIDQLTIGSSSKMWTYFAPNGSPATLGVGDQLIATIEFTPRGAMYSTTSKNFRFGIFNDPTDDQLLSDTNSDNGGGRWYDSRGYAVMLTLSPDSTAGTIQVGKRTNVTGTDGLLSSTGTYTWNTGSGQANNLILNTKYTLTLTLNRTAADELTVTFTFSDANGVIASNSQTDNGLGSLPIYTSFDQLFFRMSSVTGAADVLDYNRIQVEHIVAEYEGPPVGTSTSIEAYQSCRTEGEANAGNNMPDNNKLTVRSSSPGAKSWMKFDVSGLDVSTLRAASLTVTLWEPEAGTNTCAVSAVNDDCLDNIDWVDTTLAWDNAPGNLTTDLALLDSTKTTSVGTLNVVNGLIGQSYSIDVLPMVQADTDGIVQFVLHNSNVMMVFTTHDSPTQPTWGPMLTVVEPPLGADYPIPYSGKTVTTSLASLQWVNPDPNNEGGVITCDVYLGTDPNRPEMDKVTLAAGQEMAAINATNFPNFAPLADKTTYYWIVDCHDTTRDEVIEGLVWSFYTENNQAPSNVNAGADQVTWLVSGAASVNLAGSASDDGLPNPPALLTYLWERVAGPATAVINTATALSTSVDFAEAGDYTFRLTADDSDKQTPDTVRVVVGTDACDASHVFSGSDYDPGDFNEDCMVDMLDFAELISRNWLICTDELTNCGL